LRYVKVGVAGSRYGLVTIPLAEMGGRVVQTPLQITFQGMPQSDAIEARIRAKAMELEQFADRITGCRVVVEAPHQRGRKGILYQIKVDLTLPGGEIVANRAKRRHHGHEDVNVAIRDAFKAARRQLEDFVRKNRGEIKRHEAPPHGTVANLFPDYGFIRTSDGREIYFHANAVVEQGFAALEVGDPVRFVEVEGEKGSQASTVQPIGKHHIVAPK